MVSYRKSTSKSWADIMDEEDDDNGFFDEIVRFKGARPIAQHDKASLATIEEEMETLLEAVVSSGLWMEEESVIAGEQAKRDGLEDCYASPTSVLAPPSSTESSNPSCGSSPRSSPGPSTPTCPRQPSGLQQEAFQAQGSDEDSQHSTASSACNSQQTAAFSCCQAAQAGMQRKGMQQHLDSVACTIAQSDLGFPARLFTRLDLLLPYNARKPPLHPGELHPAEVKRLQQGKSHSSQQPSRRDLLLLMWSTCDFRPEDERDNRRAKLDDLLAACEADDNEDMQDVTAAGENSQPLLQSPVDQTTASQPLQWAKDPVTAQCSSTGEVMVDGTKHLSENGEDFGPNGYWCRWTNLEGVSATGKMEWEERWWEESDWTGMHEVGVTKSGSRADGAEWIGTWREGTMIDQTSGEPIAERSAHTWACDGQGGEWEEQWGEQHRSLGRANKFVDHWRKDGDNMSHERWGEDYLGNGWVRKHGSSSTGEHWDVLEPVNIYHSPAPHFTSVMAPDQCSPHSQYRPDTPRTAGHSRHPRAAARRAVNHGDDTPRPQRRLQHGRLPQPSPSPGKQQKASGAFNQAARHPPIGRASTMSQRSPRGRSPNVGVNRQGGSAAPSNDRAAQGSRAPQSRPCEAAGTLPAPAAQAVIMQPPVPACASIDIGSCSVPAQRRPEHDPRICTTVASAASAEAVPNSITFGSFGSVGGRGDAIDEEPARPEEQHEAHALDSSRAAAPPEPAVDASIVSGSFGSNNRSRLTADEQAQEAQASNRSHAALPIMFGTFTEDLGELPAEVGSTGHLRRLAECCAAAVAPAAEQPLEDEGQPGGCGEASGSSNATSARPVLEDATEPSGAMQSPAASPIAEVSQEVAAECPPSRQPHDTLHASLPSQQPPENVTNQQTVAAPLLPAAEQTSIRGPQCPPAPTCSNEVGEHLPLPVYLCSFLQANTSEWLQAPLQVAVNTVLYISAAIAALAQTFTC